MRYIFICFLFLFSCSQSDDNLSIFKYNEVSGISTLDPVYSKDQATTWVANQLFNGLVQLDSNLCVIPCIAKGWDISDDALEYTFLLRDDVYFHYHETFDNPRKVISSDFQYSFQRLIDEKIASPGAWVLNNVKDFYSINDTIFKIELYKPFPGFLSLLSMKYCSVVPYEIVETVNFNKTPIGTGPFVFQLWKDGVKLVLRRNANYFEKDSINLIPYLDAVSITFIKDKHSAFLKFIQGDLDLISGLDLSYKDDLLTKEGELKRKHVNKIKLYSKSYLNVEYLGFLMHSPLPIDVRMAINHGFDRVKMIKYLRNNIGVPALNGFIPLGMPSFSKDVHAYKYDKEYAIKLLNESKFDLSQEIVIYTTSSYLDLCKFMQSQLAEIGLNLSIEVSPPSTHRQMVSTSRLPFFRASWIADYPDAENYLSLFYSKNLSPKGPNYTHFSDPVYDSLYEYSLSQTNNSERYINYQKMNQIIIDSAIIVPLYYDQALSFVQNNVYSYKINAMNLLDLKRVKKVNSK